jgi:DNA-binding MarR family transcriptional regulator
MAPRSRSKLVARILDLEVGMHSAVGYVDPVAWLGTELTMTQVKVLFVLHAGPPKSLKDLARTLATSVAAASPVVDRLVQQGLVLRAEDPNDRRFVALSLTDDGRALAGRLHQDSRLRTKALLDVMTDDELALVADAMDTMLAAAQRLHQGKKS